MKKIVNFIKQRWFVSLLGVIALGLFVWFVGPLFAFADYAPLEDELNRWYAIGVIFIFWILARCWSYFKAKKQNSQIMDAMSGGEPQLSVDEQASQDEVQVLQSKMTEALGVLKNSRLGNGPDKKFLYQLPWYIIIGPPGAGKTTLLKNSDLKFPLSDQFGKDAVRGVGGTRHCDWWFAEDAVLLDTAGRYTTQDSHEPVDQAAWLGFLDLLKKNRKRRPINGVMIAVSLSDLLEQNEEQRLAQARSIKQRIKELHERFNIRFPIYLLLTKCDLLSGFMEYFDDFDRDARSQVWGMTFNLDQSKEQNIVEQFKHEFGLLQQQLQHQLLDKLERERGRERREHIYTFPQQFNALNDALSPLIEEVFQSTRYAHEAMFRGVYFTSATQEGSPIDRIMGALSSSFGLNQQSNLAVSGQGKSFFVNNLLQKVVFAESGLAGANVKLEKKKRWFQRGAFIAVSGLTALMAFAWVTSYISNTSYTEKVSREADAIDARVQNIDPNNSDPLVIIPLLDEVRGIQGGYDNQDDGTPWGFGFGLYQGDKLGEAAQSLYRTLLKDAFLPRLMTRIETQLQNNTNNTEYLYETLKVYLMLGKPEHFDKTAISAWYRLDWKYNLPSDTTTGQREALGQHLAALLERPIAPLPRPLNTRIITQTQALLQDTPMAKRVYSGLKLALKKNGVADYRVNEKSGRDSTLVLESRSGKPLTTGVPGLFTCSGYKDVFLKHKDALIIQHASSHWILGAQQETTLSDLEIKMLNEDVLKLYFQDYIHHWDDLLNDIQLKPFSTQAQTIEVLNIISGTHSPIKAFLESADLETSMSCLVKEEQSLLDKAGEKLHSARSSLDRLMQSTADNSNAPVSTVTTNLVIEHFKDLHELVQAKEGVPPPLDRSLSILNELYVYFNSIQGSSGDALVLEQKKEIARIIDKVRLEGKRSPFPVSRMMDAISVTSNNLVTGGVKKHLNGMWRSDVLPFCQKAIQGLYPIGNKSREITFEDFTYFFAPSGLMDEFFNKYLKPSVEKGRGNWRWNNRGQGGAGISSAALRQFQRADNIKNIFFRMGKQSPKVSFKLKPISMDSSITQFTMNIDGQTLTYAHGPVRPVAMKWPGNDESGQVRIQLLPPLQGYSGLSKEGPWALFRLFDEAHISRTGNPAVFILTFNIQGRKAKFELRANSAVNPFQLTDLKAFRCPQNL